MTIPEVIGSSIIRLESVDSTNKFVSDTLAREDYKEGSIVITDHQHSGKGLDKNKWESEKGKNLTFTMVLRPVFLSPGEQFFLNKIIALAVYDFVRSYLPEHMVHIKWPNDIYIENKKVAGILINNTIKGNQFETSIVGIGININQRVFVSDAPNPVSLVNYLTYEADLDECLQVIIRTLNKRYFQLSVRDFDKIDEDYFRDIYRQNEWATFKKGSETFMAKITGVTEYGQLVLETEQGDTLQFEFKEVEFLIP